MFKFEMVKNKRNTCQLTCIRVLTKLYTRLKTNKLLLRETLEPQRLLKQKGQIRRSINY